MKAKQGRPSLAAGKGRPAMLLESQREEIRRLVNRGVGIGQAAQLFGYSRRTVSRITRRRNGDSKRVSGRGKRGMTEFDKRAVEMLTFSGHPLSVIVSLLNDVDPRQIAEFIFSGGGGETAR